MISEVCWSTGLRIPEHQLEQLLNELRAARSEPCHFVIDGAHSVGNAGPPYMDRSPYCEAYVFSGHKWLMAPEPCGFLVSKQASAAYDAWVSDLPASAAGSATVCGLRTALQAFTRLNVDVRAAMVTALDRALMSRVQERFVRVGSETNLAPTQLLSLKPRPGFRWKHEKESLGEALITHRLSALIIPPQVSVASKTTWIRLSLPFFAEVKDMDHLGDLLSSLVTEDK